MLDAKDKLTGLPVDLYDLFAPAYAAGARVHNNSWGSLAAGSYRIASREVDDFVHDHRDMVIVFSAGNAGQSADPMVPDKRNVDPGYVNRKSLGAPATAKNCISVGASRSDRTAGGYSTLTYGAWDAFPEAAGQEAKDISKQTVSGNPEGIAGFSSRGPCDGERMKPDLVAPGTDVISCKSSIAPLSNYWGPLPPGHDYAYNGGTSMAAPLVAGCAALVRQYYRTHRNHSPSAALVKATLINGCRWMSGDDSIANHGKAPNYHQGFGRIDMQNTLPVVLNAAGQVPFSLHFIDPWQDATRHLRITGQGHQYRFTLPSDGTLRICLAYTDLPAPGLNNNLNLLLQRLPSPLTKWNGNEDVPGSLGGPDPTNNVEVIRFDSANPARAGDYVIQVTAFNLLGGPGQDYALVVTSSATIANWELLI